MSERKRIAVAFLEEGYTACPTQWEGIADDGKEVYVRYRCGRLRVECGLNNWIYSEMVGEKYDGHMKTEVMQRHTASIIDWSNTVVARREMEEWYPFEGLPESE
ncbi:MAG: hypothetical protein P4L67_04460 [Candidatus Pacebacteria bacterium]|nr:hypothetical protein [Candidatus Paceibacterota bacterium]